MIGLSQFLHRLLQPIYDRISFETTYIKGSDAILAIDQYRKQGYLQSTTLFVTLHVHRILSMFNHQQTIQTLECFLQQYIPSKEIQGITISTIIQLVRFILYHQRFIYNNKHYRQIHGSNSDSPLMLVLANILLVDWEQSIVVSFKEKNEIYGRFVN